MIRQDNPVEPRPGTSRQGESKGKHTYQTRYVRGFPHLFFSVDRVVPCASTENSPLTCLSRTNVSPPLFPSSNADDQSVGARLSLFSKEWRSVTNDPWIFQIVDSGFRIDFISRPLQSADPGECSMS
jgi:hypothetical protein